MAFCLWFQVTAAVLSVLLWHVKYLCCEFCMLGNSRGKVSDVHEAFQAKTEALTHKIGAELRCLPVSLW